MDYIIDGYGIEVEYSLSPEGAYFYVPDTLPKETYKKLCERLRSENDVLSITKTPNVKAVHRGAKFQEAHDKLIGLYQSENLKFRIRS